MSEPWFDPNTFGAYYGGFVGGGTGFVGGIVGALAGGRAPRCKRSRFLLGFMLLLVILGVAQVGFGLFALIVGQPYGIWHGPLLCGAITSSVFGSLIPGVRRRYAQFEERKRSEASGGPKG